MRGTDEIYVCDRSRAGICVFVHAHSLDLKACMLCVTVNWAYKRAKIKTHNTVMS